MQAFVDSDWVYIAGRGLALSGESLRRYPVSIYDSC